MRKIFQVFFAAVVFFWLGCSSGKQAANSPTIRVMTYNIHHGEGMDGKVDIKRIAKVILDAKADIVALQEVDRGVERTKKIDMMTMLSDLTGMTYAFGKNIDYLGGDYGNGILTRFPILEEKNLHYKMIREGEQRGLLQLVLDVKGYEFVLMNTHIDYREDDTERLSNVRELHDAMQKYNPRPVIACGDFNDTPDSRTAARMKERFQDSWGIVGSRNGATYPTNSPTKRIDYIFYSRNSANDRSTWSAPLLKPISARVIQSDASDHLPVLVEFEISTEY